MLVQLKYLKPGCVVTRDVEGKTINPIIPKGTEMQPIHIKVLSQFQINEVDVAKTLANGENFTPKEENEIEEIDDFSIFLQHFHQSMKETKELHEQIKNRVPIDIVRVRSHLIPLIEEAEKIPEIIFTLPNYTDEEEYPFYQSISVAILSTLIAKKLKFTHGDQLQIGLASYLSNSGMALIDDKVTKKKGKLTDEEFKVIKQHPVLSYRLVEKLTMLKYEAKIAILQHHERLDGSGYPFGLKNEKIHLYARLIGVSEMFVAMTANRSYQEKKLPYTVMEEMLTQQFGKLDLEIVQTMVKGLMSFSIGSKVLLTNGDVGEVVYIDEKNPTRPIVRLDEDQSILLLKDHREIHIEKLLYGVD